jgi:hypothetical protein
VKDRRGVVRLIGKSKKGETLVEDSIVVHQFVPYVELTPDKLEFDAKGGTQTVTIGKTNLTNLKVRANSNDIKLKFEGNTITVTMDENKTSGVRGGTIYVEGKDPDGTTGDYGVILVTQKAGSSSQGEILSKFYEMQVDIDLSGVDKTDGGSGSGIYESLTFYNSDYGDFAVEKIGDHISVTGSYSTELWGGGWTSWSVYFVTEGAASGVDRNIYGKILEYTISNTKKDSDGNVVRSFTLKGKDMPIYERAWYRWEHDNITNEYMSAQTLEWTESDNKGNVHDFKFVEKSSNYFRFTLRDRE